MFTLSSKVTTHLPPKIHIFFPTNTLINFLEENTTNRTFKGHIWK